MIMDSRYTDLSGQKNNSRIDDQTSLYSNDYQNVENRFTFDALLPDPSLVSGPVYPLNLYPDNFGLNFTLSPGGQQSFVPSTSTRPDGPFDPFQDWMPEGGEASLTDGSDSSDPVLKYISQMLLEENMEEQPHMFCDPFALRETEKSLYDVIGEQYPSALNSAQPYVNHDSPSSSSLSGCSSDCGGINNNNTITDTPDTARTRDFVDPDWAAEDGGLNPVVAQTSLSDGHQFSLQPASKLSINPSNDLDGLMGPSLSQIVDDMFNDKDSVLQFKKGLEEASKFLPSPAKLVSELESSKFVTDQKQEATTVAVKVGEIEKKRFPIGSMDRKNHDREDSDFEEGRSNKQTVVYVEDSELSDMFDKVLLLPVVHDNLECPYLHAEHAGASSTSQLHERSNGSKGGKSRSKKQGRKKEAVDLTNLLVLCAQAVSANDFRTAYELLKQIRQHSSVNGDGSQRLAHWFANGLEARLAGRSGGVQNFFTVMTSRRTTAAEILNAYKTFLQASPFLRLSILFANKMIYYASEKAATLHILDFGVMYGFQWPVLLQLLGMRPGGPPKLRITGIEYPQRGFRPTERIEDTGRRLKKYCERFKVPFEYNPVASQDWEDIRIEDLKIKSNEVLAVNCIGRFKNLLDETDEVNCPRDAVLNLIRRMNPDIFVHTIINGSYNAPFFLARFREAIFQFSSVFDIFDTTLPREDLERLMLEEEFLGREAMNVIACEGLERVERPETYKQWHVRMVRAGFKQLPLNQELMQQLRGRLKASYDKDFVIDEANNWMLQGWKGRLIYGSSCWVPA